MELSLIDNFSKYTNKSFQNFEIYFSSSSLCLQNRTIPLKTKVQYSYNYYKGSKQNNIFLGKKNINNKAIP